MSCTREVLLVRMEGYDFDLVKGRDCYCFGGLLKFMEISLTKKRICSIALLCNIEEYFRPG